MHEDHVQTEMAIFLIYDSDNNALPSSPPPPHCCMKYSLFWKNRFNVLHLYLIGCISGDTYLDILTFYSFKYFFLVSQMKNCYKIHMHYRGVFDLYQINLFFQNLIYRKV